MSRQQNIPHHTDTITFMVDKSLDDGEAWKDRQVAELELLNAMYPDQIQWYEQRQELIYTSPANAILTLRLPDGYPVKSQPILLSASNKNKDDLRDPTRQSIENMKLAEGEEMLDAVIQNFEDYLSQHPINQPNGQQKDDTFVNEEKHKTTIVWLHHLLNTNKRKLATNPTFRTTDVVGVTKRGHPGVLVFSGKASAVDEHVTELKSQRWQAFQVRFEELMDSPWKFAHSSGISEVETMADITSAITGDAEKENFLKAMNIK